MRMTKLLTLGLVLTLAWQARAATFVVTIKNTSQEYMAPGVLTLSPLLAIGPAPNPGTKQFATYEYARIDCDAPDSWCPAGSDFWCYFANEDTLIGRWGLTNGTNAWVPTPPSLLLTVQHPRVRRPATRRRVVITAQPGQKLSYVSKAGDFNNYFDQIVMMHATRQSRRSDGAAVRRQRAAALQHHLRSRRLHRVELEPDQRHRRAVRELVPGCRTGRPAAATSRVGSTATGAELPDQPARASLSTAWSWTAPAGYTTDGMALRRPDLVERQRARRLARGRRRHRQHHRRRPRGGALGDGRAALEVRRPRAGNDFMGFPMVENLDGTGLNEYLVSEFGQSTPLPGAAVYARSGDSVTAKWTSTGYGFPGMWNMGPSAGDVRSDNTGNEVVIADYNGDIVVLKESDATTLNTYNLFASNSDNIYGHAAIGNVDGVTGNEIVVVGANTGKVYALKAKTGTGVQGMTLAYTSAAPLNGGYAFGSGPAIADLDGDGKAEIIIATGGSGAVYAYSPSSGSTACKYKWSTPGGFDYSWSSPVVGDVDNDGKPEIVVFSSDGVLSVLEVPKAGSGCTEGTVGWKYTVGNGGPAWFTPALANITGGNGLDIIVANYQTLEVLDYSLKRPVWRYNDASAQVLPDGARRSRHDGRAGDASTCRLDQRQGDRADHAEGRAAAAASAWSTFMGANTRSGSK